MLTQEVPPDPAPWSNPMEYFLGMDPKNHPVQPLCCPGRSLRSPRSFSAPGEPLQLSQPPPSPWNISMASFQDLLVFPGSIPVIPVRGALTQPKTRSGAETSEAASGNLQNLFLPSFLPCGIPKPPVGNLRARSDPGEPRRARFPPLERARAHEHSLPHGNAGISMGKGPLLQRAPDPAGS